jgi:hypothetical protein
MKKMLCVIASLVIFASLSAQQFQTKESGNITDQSIFLQKVSNSNKWVDAVCAPYGYVTVNKNDTVVINQQYDLDSICVKAGGVLIINAQLNLLIPIIIKGTAVIGGDTTLVQLPLTTGIQDVVPDNFFGIYSRNGMLKVSVHNYGELYIYNTIGQLLYKEDLNGAGGYEIPVNFRSNGVFIARFVSSNIESVKKFFYNK